MNENKRRRLLRNITFGGLLLIVGAFFGVIFQGLFWSPATDQETAYATLTTGETRMQRNQQQRYWVTKLSVQQHEQLLQLTRVVHQNVGCDSDSEFCAISAKAQRSGVLIQFVLQKPTQLPIDTVWFGGFVDPSTGGVYDLLGRGYLSNPRNALKELNRP